MEFIADKWFSESTTKPHLQNISTVKRACMLSNKDLLRILRQYVKNPESIDSITKADIKAGKVVSCNQYQSSTRGCTKGKERDSQKLAGGTIIVDHVTNLVFTKHQTLLQPLLKAKMSVNKSLTPWGLPSVSMLLIIILPDERNGKQTVLININLQQNTVALVSATKIRLSATFKLFLIVSELWWFTLCSIGLKQHIIKSISDPSQMIMLHSCIIIFPPRKTITMRQLNWFEIAFSQISIISSKLTPLDALSMCLIPDSKIMNESPNGNIESMWD